MSTPFKMKGMSFGNSPMKQEKYLTRKEEEEAVDLTRKDGPRVTEKEKKDRQDKARQEREKANRFEHNVEAKMDHYRDTFRK